MTEAILEVRHLNLDIVNGRKSIPILRDVSFSVRDGELRGIAGESGYCPDQSSAVSPASKSTALPSEPIRHPSGIAPSP